RPLVNAFTNGLCRFPLEFFCGDKRNGRLSSGCPLRGFGNLFIQEMVSFRLPGRPRPCRSVLM
ncbi:hypothetical protein, partial [Achromobacter xylosoxidans]|uniref:hypothetical protein n=1 Tax=Alcaligenes xylosoxydans xylosoxydans TaxID=85698 RepID=UPI00195524E4